MAFFDKLYKFDREEYFEEYVNGLGLPDDQAKKFLNYKPTQSLSKKGDSYVYTAFTGEAKNEIVFKSGVEFDEKVRDATCKTVFTVDGNTTTQVQKYPNGQVFTITRDFTPDELVVTIKCSFNDIVARRYYKA